MAQGYAGRVDDRSGDSFAADLTLYLLARFALVALVAAVLMLAFATPAVVAVLVGLVVNFPLALLLLRPLNAKVTAGLAVRGERRQAERQRLRAQLRGETSTDVGDDR